MARVKNEAAPAPDAPVRFKNVSPLGALEVPALGRVIQSSEVFEVRPDIAELLDGQDANFAPATQEDFDAWVASLENGETDDDAA